jgi:hypothetical protein
MVMTEVLEYKMVERDEVVVTMVSEPEVMVAVTGHVVTEDEMITVVILVGLTGPGTLDVFSGETELLGGGVHLVQMTEVDVTSTVEIVDVV